MDLSSKRAVKKDPTHQSTCRQLTTRGFVYANSKPDFLHVSFVLILSFFHLKILVLIKHPVTTYYEIIRYNNVTIIKKEVLNGHPQINEILKNNFSKCVILDY